ncbi:MAG: alpha/beta hydrolase [Myxococcales bacterium]|nr:alpha/beta hydrolase [Myxococcales bacterium]
MDALTIGEARLEYVRHAGDPARPAVVMLHEGLGAARQWRDLPATLAAATGATVIAYSRAGYGGSSPLPDGDDPRGPRRGLRRPDFMHREADLVLPPLLAALGVARPVLIGHSDGGSIALLHARRHPVAAVIAIAPHVFVEPCSIDAITAAREAYLHGDLRARLARHHADVDGAFWGWNDVWLSSEFRAWDIVADLATVAAPVLAIQGDADPYGTMAQVEAIARACPRTTLLRVAGAGHAPHRDRPDQVLPAIADAVRDAALG